MQVDLTWILNAHLEYNLYVHAYLPGADLALLPGLVPGLVPVVRSIQSSNSVSHDQIHFSQPLPKMLRPFLVALRDVNGS